MSLADPFLSSLFSTLLPHTKGKKMFSVTNLFIFQGRLSENRCNYSESKLLSHLKWNKYRKVFQISCVYSGYCWIFNVETINLPSFLTLYCSSRESTLTNSESTESGLDLYVNRGQYFSWESLLIGTKSLGSFLVIPQSGILLVMSSGEPVRKETWFF